MRFVDQRLQAFIENMRVNLSSCDIGMAQHLLQGAQVGAVRQSFLAALAANHQDPPIPGDRRLRQADRPVPIP
jgi:hypothetical protein